MATASINDTQAPGAAAAAADCFHCGQPVPDGFDRSVHIAGHDEPMCCHGCAAVARAIVDSGLTDFYRLRTEPAPNARELVPEALKRLIIYDDPSVQKGFVRSEEGLRVASLILEGISCAACVWLNERHVAALPGVKSVQINYATRRARVVWDDARIRLSDILRAIGEIGYIAHPYDPARHHEILERERRELLKRLGVAGILGMQVMILAVSLYAGAFSGIERGFERFFRWTSLVLVLPVLGYSAQPFFRAAVRDLRARRIGMDVPVSLGLIVAFGGSLWATLTMHGEVYYDSIVMFVFLLLGARFFELVARVHAARAIEPLANRTPDAAIRLRDDGNDDVVPITSLCVGDRVRIRPGDIVPADGHVLEGQSSADESLLTGESMPVAKGVGDLVVGGSLNVESPLIVRVERTGDDTLLSGILRLLERAQGEKPRIAQLADRVAVWFVGAVLLATVVVAAIWWVADSTRLLPIVIAMLVVTCPCALSLATPAAITAVTGNLARRGLLVTRGRAIEALARATHVAFDKTGTLTLGRPQVVEVRTFGGTADRDARTIASALERYSEHPIARAIIAAAGSVPAPAATELTNVPGAGIMGIVGAHRYRVGTRRFIAAAGIRAPTADETSTLVFLADENSVLAVFRIEDEIRPDAEALVTQCRRLGLKPVLLTGDHAAVARRVAAAVGIEQSDVRADLTPADKLDEIRRLRETGAVVAMIGDGVNDAAALAAAHVSIAIATGSPLAAASADMVLMSPHLAALEQGVELARKTIRIIRQNLTRSLLYNSVALPAAALGYVPPWLAAIGMSASSLLVVLNALRLAGGRAPSATVTS